MRCFFVLFFLYSVLTIQLSYSTRLGINRESCGKRIMIQIAIRLIATKGNAFTEIASRLSLEIPEATNMFSPRGGVAKPHDTKVNRVNAKGCHKRQKNRRYQHDNGKGFHEHTEEEQEDCHH